MSRRSSIASGCRCSASAASTGEADVATEAEDPVVEAFNKLRKEHFDIIYQAFQAFIQATGKLPLVTRTRNMVPNSKAFTDSVTERTTGLEDKDTRSSPRLPIANTRLMNVYYRHRR